jgi:hypothetical protein
MPKGASSFRQKEDKAKSAETIFLGKAGKDDGHLALSWDTTNKLTVTWEHGKSLQKMRIAIQNSTGGVCVS